MPGCCCCCVCGGRGWCRWLRRCRGQCGVVSLLNDLLRQRWLYPWIRCSAHVNSETFPRQFALTRSTRRLCLPCNHSRVRGATSTPRDRRASSQASCSGFLPSAVFGCPQLASRGYDLTASGILAFSASVVMNASISDGRNLRALEESIKKGIVGLT